MDLKDGGKVDVVLEGGGLLDPFTLAPLATSPGVEEDDGPAPEAKTVLFVWLEAGAPPLPPRISSTSSSCRLEQGAQVHPYPLEGLA